MSTRASLAALAVVFLSAASLNAADRPNVILVMADDQGWGDVSYNGHKAIKTPELDKAAAEGVRFDRFYAAAPVCSPTRCSVLTGRNPNRSAVYAWGWPIRPQEITLAERLNAAGYTTAHFGKWHLGSVRNDSPVNPGKNGFDRWVSAPNFYDNDPILCDQGKAVQYKGESSDVTADLATDWIREQAKGDKPFFAVVWFGSPHDPHIAADGDRELYKNEPKGFQDYYGEITGIDRAYGKIRSTLKDLGIRDNTILWYCSDNGADKRRGSAGPFREKKGSIYDGGLLVPAILDWPAHFPTPQTTEMRATTCDIFPTVLAAAGLPLDEGRPLDGVNLLPLLAEKVEKRPTPIAFWQTPNKGVSTPSATLMGDLLAKQQAGGDLPADEVSVHAADLPQPVISTESFPGHAALTDGDWKLHRIENAKGAVRFELYDLASDPYEKEDVLSQYPEETAKLKKLLQKWETSVVNSLNGADYK
ncbi:sulfatase-like hydrolase/transferase [Blastopirellula sp. JC732]|uniref:Sulfatase-like hydrolase/transferase n=1 Tax=Blastopirellula sediminis TaxID=2894196 RepID=A0A9X1SHL4_9BACT|nr:sulfatase-like hydrolase/transferase [Blastopirellula sediminis]MCC9606435.1 sulfatase-like hydrolase/transferase [Blastopirellula sediminis]MCC9630267.1 sulfatase-like hydrolase/transferase [Blastopirellula sediminis]